MKGGRRYVPANVFSAMAIPLVLAGCGPLPGNADPPGAAPPAGLSPIEMRQSAASTSCPDNPVCAKEALKKIIGVIKEAKDMAKDISSGIDVAVAVWQFLTHTRPPSMADQLAAMEQDLSNQIVATDWKISATTLSEQQANVNSWLNAAFIAGGTLPNDAPTNAGASQGAIWAKDPINFLRVYTAHGNDGAVLWSSGGRDYRWKDYTSRRPPVIAGGGANDVYDWRLGLPNLAELTAKRLELIGAEDGNFRTNLSMSSGFRSELEGYRAVLEQHYVKIIQGTTCLLTFVGNPTACADMNTGDSVKGTTQLSLDPTDFYDGGWYFRTADMLRQQLINEGGVEHVRIMSDRLAYLNGILPIQQYVGRPPVSFTSNGLAGRITWNRATGQWRIWNHNAQKVYRQTAPGLTDPDIGNPSGWTFYPIWGTVGDIPVPGNYGQGPQLAVWRPSDGTWYFTKGPGTTTSTPSVVLGEAGEIPVPAAWRAGSTDLVPATWNPGTGKWRIQGSSLVEWGTLGDIPVPGDYNNDGITDCAVFRPKDGTWYILNDCYGPAGWRSVQWGGYGDIPVPGDYDGDSKLDLAVFRPDDGTGRSYWWILPGSGAAYSVVEWGIPGDIPVPGPGPGRYGSPVSTHVVVYRPSENTWYNRNTGEVSVNGTAGDIPIP
jgi:hypothetical protein